MITIWTGRTKALKFAIKLALMDNYMKIVPVYRTHNHV